MSAPALVWLHRELRLADNPALDAALASGRPVLPVFVLDDAAPGAWAAGGAARWWLHHSLASLAADLGARDGALILRRGAWAETLPRLVRETGAAEVHAGVPTEPWARRAVADTAAALGAPLRLHPTTLLHDPDAIRTQGGTPFGVFTPFARACHARLAPHVPRPPPARVPAPAALPASDALDAWRLVPRDPDWAEGLRATWRPGEAGARARLAAFLDHALHAYDRARDEPAGETTSRLSPHLHWGEIAPAAVWHAARAASQTAAGDGRGTEKFLDELLWREFSAHLLWHHPDLPEQPLRREFAAMPWRHDPDALRAWQRGRTGLPIVDAGMRQLWHTGWMHNRARMIVASVLVKHLLLPWQDGQAWFWDTLVDADLASNAASWQWVAGCGADAAPYFRIFNPVVQGRKFDLDGTYVRRWVPELAAIPAAHVHAPWEAGPLALRAAGYPAPVVDLAAGRQRALDALRTVQAARA